MSLAKAHEWKYLAQKAMAQRDKALARAERAEAALAESKVPCAWTYSDAGECYEAPCGNKDRYKSYFCGTCGHRVEVQP